MLLEMSNELVEIVPGRVWSFDDGSPLLMDLEGNQKVVNPRKIEIYPDAFTGTVCWYLRDLPDEVLSGVIRHSGATRSSCAADRACPPTAVPVPLPRRIGARLRAVLDAVQ
jgi:hypothetical protein